MNALKPLITQFHRNCETVESRKKDLKWALKSLKRKRIAAN
jgi:hypothetical protein